ncbi:heterokaryon incompatibility protein-domain-containing protein [Whalleya microplaca]|nr:heterokaryon incompatibility protein-domain-containing protein [Whalleya microplaca]
MDRSGIKTLDTPMFPYRELPAGHIRLLWPYCDSGDALPREDLSYDLLSFPINSCPNYIALSYTWGTKKAVEAISIDGQDGLVQFNLYTFLQQHSKWLHSSLRGRPLLWVDAVCINQLDSEEKSRQLTMMGEIYMKARRTVIWLGEHDCGSSIAIDCWLRLADKARRQEQTSFSDVSQAEIEALDHLALRDYWHRVWVWQEVTTPNTPGEIWCGDKRIPLEDAVLANDAVRMLLLGSRRVTSLIPWLPKLQSMHELAQIRAAHTGAEGAIDKSILSGTEYWASLVSMLYTTRDLEATDARDRVYALFPIYKNICGRSPFKVDNGRLVEEIYIDASTFILEEEQDLRLLLLCNASSVPVSVNSWIPNFKNLDQPFEIFNVQGLFHASGSKPPQVDVRRRYVSIRGAIVDTVATTHPSLTHPSEQTSLFDTRYWQPKFADWFSSMAKFISKGQGDRKYNLHLQLSQAADK